MLEDEFTAQVGKRTVKFGYLGCLQVARYWDAQAPKGSEKPSQFTVHDAWIYALKEGAKNAGEELTDDELKRLREPELIALVLRLLEISGLTQPAGEAKAVVGTISSDTGENSTAA